LVARLGIKGYPSEDLKPRRITCLLNLTESDNEEEQGSLTKGVYGRPYGSQTCNLLIKRQEAYLLSNTDYSYLVSDIWKYSCDLCSTCYLLLSSVVKFVSKNVSSLFDYSCGKHRQLLGLPVWLPFFLLVLVEHSYLP